VFVSPRDDFYSSSSSYSNGEELPDEEFAPESEDLPTFVLRQIAPDLESEDRMIAAHILTSLDEDGLLSTPIWEIARYHHMPLARIENVLRLIQHADPVGVGSPSPQAALLVQLETLSEIRPAPPLAAQAIQQGMGLLSRHHYKELGRLMGIPSSQAKEIAQYISDNLNPYPARAHWGDIHQAAEAPNRTYHFPDVMISRLHDVPESPLVVEVISPLAGSLRINPLFREALHQAPEG